MIHNSKGKNADFKFFNSKSKKALYLAFILIVSGVIGISIANDIKNSKNSIILATTTSTYDSGLLDYLLPSFEKKSGIKVDILSVGTGQALETAKRGDADALLVHSRSREEDFVENGHGIHRVCIMYNSFLIIGPDEDPAKIKGENITTAMRILKNMGDSGLSRFYSRGDNSGTHSKELSLWTLINFVPDSQNDYWYLETGSGMGTTLTIANENNGYTLIDSGTWLSAKSNIKLIPLVEGDQILINPYGAILTNPENHLAVKYDLALTFVAFLTSKEGQDLIGSYKLNNETLFFPSFGHGNETYGCQTANNEIEFWKEYNGGFTGY